MEILHSKIEGEGRPLIIMHGFLGMSDNWKTLSGKYAEAGFQVHALDLRNHGRSFHSEDFSYAAMTEDLLNYLDHHGIATADIIGHSMGGKVGMFFATSHPQRTKSLIVADIAPKYYRPHHDEILDGLSAIDFTQKPDRAQADEILAAYVPDAGTRQFLLKSLYWKEPGQLAFRFNLDVFLKSRDIIGDELTSGARYDGPAIFLRGANSRYIKDEDAPLIKVHFPQAKIVDIPNAGHWLHAENPQAFLDESLRFLKQP